MPTLSPLPALLLACLLPALVAAQTPELHWLKDNKNPKGEQYSTKALLRAGPEGFYLLQTGGGPLTSSNDFGRMTPQVHYLAVLSPTGDLIRRERLPEFSEAEYINLGCLVSGDSLLLAVYGPPGAAPGAALQARVLNILTGRWLGPPTVLATCDGGFPTVWFARSPNGSHICVFAQHGSASAAEIGFYMFNARFELLWQRRLKTPEKVGGIQQDYVYCTNRGQAVMVGRAYAQARWTIALRPAPVVYNGTGSASDDGLPMLRSRDRDYYPAIALVSGESAESTWFYADTRQKSVVSSRLVENAAGELWYIALLGGDDPAVPASYLTCSLDPAARQWKLLQRGALSDQLSPAALAPRREADWRVSLREISWPATGPVTALVEAEHYNEERRELSFGHLALLRFDSTGRLKTVKAIEKSQTFQYTKGKAAGEEAGAWTAPLPGARGSVAACPQQRGGWWLLWNKGDWPNSELWFADARKVKPEPELLAKNSGLVLSMLPHTLLQYDKKWWFAGESPSGDRFGVGYVGKK
jgi:hypothetical protein